MPFLGCVTGIPCIWGGKDMLSPYERKKMSSFTKSLLHGSDLKRYEELYGIYAAGGYTKELCEHYADEFITNVKKPMAEDIVQLASLYDRLHDNKTAGYYLDMLSDRKLGGEERLGYCIEVLKTVSKLGNWRDAEDFRTANINFMQTFGSKRPPQRQAELYMALALADNAGQHYNDAFKLLRFGYKPNGRNDTTLLEILITGVYIFACSGDKDGLEAAVDNTYNCFKLFNEFEFSWSKSYYEQRIEEAANGIL